MQQNKVLLSIENLRLSFVQGKKNLRALDGIHFDLHEGEILGLVGESGCGKSLCSLAIMGLLERNAIIESGHIYYQHDEQKIDLNTLQEDERRRYRGHHIAMIFQEPMTSLNPVYTIGDQIIEAILVHQNIGHDAAKKIALEKLDQVKIPDAKRRLNDYPHQLSGGMRQRVMIAMALSMNPKILIADEPTTALDVTIQAQILNLLEELVQQNKMSMILISHDVAVVSQLCDRLLIMYAGRIVEDMPSRLLSHRAKHPYTQGLLASIPPDVKVQRPLFNIAGKVPSLAERQHNCHFAERCHYALQACKNGKPNLRYVGMGQWVRCYNG